MKTTDTPQLPEYVCTRRFQAAKISQIGQPTAAEPKMYLLILELGDGKFDTQKVHEGYIKRNWPQVGGYFLRTEQGHARYLSAEEFEQDYAAVPNLQPVNLADIELLAGKTWNAPITKRQEMVAAMMKLIDELPPTVMDPHAFSRLQADVIRMVPPASEHLHAAPHYQDLLPHKAGK